MTVGSVALASEDGSEVYEFNAERKHVRTLDGTSMLPKYTLNYDADGWLESVVDVRATQPQVTTIERDSNGRPLEIIGPFGERTTLVLNGSGRL